MAQSSHVHQLLWLVTEGSEKLYVFLTVCESLLDSLYFLLLLSHFMTFLGSVPSIILLKMSLCKLREGHYP